MYTGRTMSNQEQTWESLDAEFDHYLVDMKPYVLKLPQKQDRQRCALWIKKLCDPSGAGTGVTGRKNRNLYAKLLLHMLKSGLLGGPFTHKPEEGMLKPLPTYMSIYFDEPNSGRFQSTGTGGLPDWVMGELESRESNASETWKFTLKDDSAFVTSPTRPKYSSSQKLASRSLSPAHRSGEDALTLLHNGDLSKRTLASFDDSDLEARLNSWNLGIEKPRYLREKPLPLSPTSPRLGRSAEYRDERTLFRLHKKEMDMKIKGMEAKFHEEKLKMQQKHDADVQKILDRKNNEIEELKTLYRTKQVESEDTIRKLEKKVQTLLRESQLIRDTKEAQILELKKLCDQSADTLKNEWEKKLHNAVADMEQEKFELQKKHTENIQELLDDTNSRLLKMEADYVLQTNVTAQTVKELEGRVQQLTVEAESSNLQRQKLSQEKTEVEASYHAACNDLQQLNSRLSSLQKDRDRLTLDYEKHVQQLQSKYECDVSFITQQNALSAAKASALIEELEDTLSRVKQQGQEREHRFQQDMRAKENKFQKEKLNLERCWERKVHDLQKQAEDQRHVAQKKISKVNELLKEKEEQLSRVTDTQRLRAQQADAALEEFKRQVELNTEKVYSEMKEQMEKVEADLSQSKALREKQSMEFSRQLEELKQRYEQQIVELKLEHEQKKTYLIQQHSTEKDNIIQDHDQEISRLEKQFKNSMLEHEKNAQAWRERNAQTISELQTQVYSLKEELIQVNSQRKQQLVELGHLRDEEKQKTAQEHHMAMSKLRAEAEAMRLELQRTHAAETQQALEKAGSRLMQIEKDYGEKLAKSKQVVCELQATVAAIREESNSQQLIMEKRLQDAAQNYDHDKRQLIKENEKVLKLLKNEAENYCNQLRLSERKIQEKQLEMQEQIMHIRQEYELKIKGLMPATVKHELENTITSLKSQVNSLQKRAQVLQEDLTFYQRL
ncbi:centrosomal protein of 112 kDa [Pseudophryne corroboree]|uniref:centrosomal protein of 112 kDa n=1 Tax=Pseudophryne corroboree TaxID=495146 RepID=UPI00308127C8